MDPHLLVSIKGVPYVVSGGGGRTLYPAGKNSWTASSVSAPHAVLARVNGRYLSGGNRAGRYRGGPLGLRKRVKDTPLGLTPADPHQAYATLSRWLGQGVPVLAHVYRPKVYFTPAVSKARNASLRSPGFEPR